MFDLKTRILVVDDMSTMRKIVMKSLKEMGFTDLIEASDGDVAWTTLQSSTPPVGLVISDWNMPKCSGLDFLKRVRADSRFKATPFMLVTAESEASQVAQALQAKVDAYIVKPFNTEVLKGKIAEVYKKVTANAA